MGVKQMLGNIMKGLQAVGIVEKGEQPPIVSDDLTTRPIVTASAQPSIVVAAPTINTVYVEAGNDSNSQELLDAVRQLIFKQPSYEPVVKFLQVTESLSTIIPDNDTRAKAAITTSQISGATILAAAQTFPSLLTAEVDSYTSAVIAPQQGHMQQLQQQLAAINDEVASITNRLQELSSAKQQLNNEILNAEQKIKSSEGTIAVVASNLTRESETLVALITKNITTSTNPVV